VVGERDSKNLPVPDRLTDIPAVKNNFGSSKNNHNMVFKDIISLKI